MAFDSSCTKAIRAALLGTTQKRCELQLFFAGIRQAVRRWKAIHFGRLNVRVCVCARACKNAYSSQTVGRTVSKFCLPPKNPRTGVCRYLARNSTTLPSGGTVLRHTSNGVRCELVWSATFLGSTSKSNTSLESSRLAEFECEISPG